MASRLRINDAGDGLLIVDTAGGANALGVSDRSGTIAKSLNLTRASKTVEIDGEPTRVIDGTTSYSIDLENLTSDAEAILLSSLNGGKGVAAGDFTIADSAGNPLGIDFNGADAGITTIGQLIELINDRAEAGGVGVTASINAAGTGILLEDTAGGDEVLTVTDVNSTTAADLKLNAKVTTVAGHQTINGAGAFTTGSAAATGLQALADRINARKCRPYRQHDFRRPGLSPVAHGRRYRQRQSTPRRRRGRGLFEETSRGEDALLYSATSRILARLLSSSDGNFAGAIGGVDVAVKEASETAVTITVRQTDAAFVEGIEDLVESYNALRTDLAKLTTFDSEALTTGLLFGSNEALQIDTRLSLAITSRYFADSNFRSLEQLGLSINDDGTLALDKSKLQTAFEDDPTGVEEFLTNANSGVAVKISAVIDRLAGADGSLLAAQRLAARLDCRQRRPARQV